MRDRLGITYNLASDPNQRVIQLFGVQNPDTRELALHAVYIINPAGEVYYRKVGLRRPLSAELIDAVDAYHGVYPQTDHVTAHNKSINVAYPTNNFQALLTISKIESLPSGINATDIAPVLTLIRATRSDDAVFAFRRLMVQHPQVSRQDWLDTAAWMTRQYYFSDNPEAMASGRDLDRRLARAKLLESQINATQGDTGPLEQQLAAARAGLTSTRAKIDQKSTAWNLRSAKTMLRAYRELARAGV